MLELPELEVIRERLRLALVGRRIAEARALDRAAFVTRNPPPAALDGAHFRNVTRRGRHLVFETDAGAAFALRLGRYGRIALRRPPTGIQRGTVFAVTLADDTGLDVIDTGRRVRLEIALAGKAAELPWLGRAGLDPLDPSFTLTALRSTLARVDTTLRLALSDNQVIAGPLDAFADEIQFEARLSPFHSTALLRAEEAIRLHLAIKRTVSNAIVRYKSLPTDILPDESHRDFLRVYRRADAPCPACGSPVRTVREGHITTHYCPHCQTSGIELADRNAPAD
ncbi:MAG: DNA-formamidopyrimidine glycosylase family protein [bacterium]